MWCRFQSQSLTLPLQEHIFIFNVLSYLPSLIFLCPLHTLYPCSSFENIRELGCQVTSNTIITSKWTSNPTQDRLDVSFLPTTLNTDVVERKIHKLCMQRWCTPQKRAEMWQWNTSVESQTHTDSQILKFLLPWHLQEEIACRVCATIV